MLYQEAFGDDFDLLGKVLFSLDKGLPASAVLPEIANYVVKLKRNQLSQTSDPVTPAGTKRPATEDDSAQGNKRARTDSTWIDPPTIVSTASGKILHPQRRNNADWESIALPSFSTADITFLQPTRKKGSLEVVDGGGLRVDTNGGGGTSVGWDDIDQIVRVPVPERATPASHFIIISKAAAADDMLVFTAPHKLPSKAGSAATDTPFDTHLQHLFDTNLRPHGKKVLEPSASQFVSAIVQSHRKGERSFHVKAWRGSKDGFLFFLSEGVLWGFRKPVEWYPLRDIVRVAYGSVLQRTFNLTVCVRSGQADADAESEEGEREIEFAMLDQADHEGVDAYVKRHGLHDASLAAARRAKVLNINGDKNKAATAAASSGPRGASGAGGPADAEDEEETELARAERELQDAEDAEEEDFDPGSEGDSDGSGVESDEEGIPTGDADGREEGDGEGEDAEDEDLG